MVLAILGMIAMIAVPQVLNYLERAKADTTRIQIESIGAALDLYRLDVGRYPSEEEGLETLVRRPVDAERWNGPYVKKSESLTEPWGNAYLHRSTGEPGSYELSSVGAAAAAEEAVLYPSARSTSFKSGNSGRSRRTRGWASIMARAIWLPVGSASNPQ